MKLTVFILNLLGQSFQSGPWS